MILNIQPESNVLLACETWSGCQPQHRQGSEPGGQRAVGPSAEEIHNDHMINLYYLIYLYIYINMIKRKQSDEKQHTTALFGSGRLPWRIPCPFWLPGVSHIRRRSSKTFQWKYMRRFPGHKSSPFRLEFITPWLNINGHNMKSKGSLHCRCHLSLRSVYHSITSNLV